MSAHLLRRVGFAALIVIVVALALDPSPTPDWLRDLVRVHWKTVRPFVLWRDVATHVAAFAVLALVGSATWGARWSLAFGLAALAGVLEVTQALIPAREPEWSDFSASLVGVAAGLALAAAVRKVRRLR